MSIYGLDMSTNQRFIDTSGRHVDGIDISGRLSLWSSNSFVAFCLRLLELNLAIPDVHSGFARLRRSTFLPRAPSVAQAIDAHIASATVSGLKLSQKRANYSPARSEL